MYPTNSQRTTLAQLPTPLQLLTRVSEHLRGPRIWVKRDDLTGTLLTGNKVRKLEYLINHAQQQNADMLLTCGGVQSNHCRATAFVAAQVGLRAHLILRGEEPADISGNLLLDHLAGAAVSYHSPKDYQRSLPRIFDHWQSSYQEREGLNVYSIPTGGSNAVGLWGYLEAAQEMERQFTQLEIDPDAIVCASGSGGTQAGLTLGFHLLRPQTRVVGMAVCDDAAYFENKVGADIAAWAALYQADRAPPKVDIYTIDRYIGAGYGKAQPEVLETIAWLARTEGLVLDPVYTGKAFHGLMQEVAQGALREAKDVVFIHTGGVFGVFPYAQQLEPFWAQ